MSGRGRGANVNKPAWLVQQERDAASSNGAGGGGGGPPPRSDGKDRGRYDDPPPGGPRDGGGRRSRSRSRDRGSPGRDQFGRSGGRGGGYGGGGGGYGGYGGYRDGPPRYDDRRGPDNWRRDDRRGGGGYRGGYRGGDRRDGGRRRRSEFASYEEERDWVENRRRQRRNRPSKFDIEPTQEQLAEQQQRAALELSHGMTRNTGATSAHGGLNGGFTPAPVAGSFANMNPNQTRHARRLYIGNIPDISETEIHSFFRKTIEKSLIMNRDDKNYAQLQEEYIANDPIVSVYINRERRFAFIEFRTMDITTACLSLDGIDVEGRGKVKVKRPNDYNASLAPQTSNGVSLDTAKLGLVSSTVPDGPNKIFIGGLPYHLTESQVLELLGAFGSVRAFHLVKSEPSATTSKGYCFVEYADPNITQVACMGLNGMDLGGGKQLSCRMAVQGLQQSGASAPAPAVNQAALEQSAELGAPVTFDAAAGGAAAAGGVDVNDLLAAALGGALPPPQAAAPVNSTPVVTDPLAVANAASNALDAAFGGTPAVKAEPGRGSGGPTRVLVLLNMVMDEDLASDEDFQMLEEEVREEVSRFGKLLSMKIPRPSDGCAPTAIKKIFLEYATVGDATSAERQLAGRAFGPNTVVAEYFDEGDYARGDLK